MLRQRVFKFVILGCIQFNVLTLIAMLVYPGSAAHDSSLTSYQFFYNFFSDLGMTETYRQEPNWVSAALFFIALTWAGVSLILFFALSPRLFRRSKLARVLATLGTIVGIVSGVCYVGIAWTPANIFLEAHVQFVIYGFQTFFVAVVLYIPAIFLEKGYPNRYGVVYAIFAVLLISYIWLLFNGPSSGTPDGLRINATGQKVIVYAAFLCMLIQGYGAAKLDDMSGK